MRSKARAMVVVATAAAVWLVAAPTRADEMNISTRLPWIPPEALPPVDLPGDPTAAVAVRIDPGDNDRPDPVPSLTLTLRTP